MRGRRREFTGRVVSNKMRKTVVVVVERSRRHPLYDKVMRVRSRFKAHSDETLQVGDTVTIAESRPLSKEKHWIVTGVVRKGEALAIPEVEIPPSKSERAHVEAGMSIQEIAGVEEPAAGRDDQTAVGTRGESP